MSKKAFLMFLFVMFFGVTALFAIEMKFKDTMKQMKLYDAKKMFPKQEVILYQIVTKEGGCYDPDGEGKGGPHKKKGTTYYIKKAIENQTDKCKDEKSLYEYYCKEVKGAPTVVKQMVPSLVSCKENEECKDGICVVIPCIDSDGGFNITAGGTATTYNLEGKETGKMTDKCHLPTQMLDEAFCKEFGDTKIADSDTVDCCGIGTGMVCDAKEGRCKSVETVEELLKACEKGKDACPLVEGFQAEYLFNNPNCVPVDDNFCYEFKESDLKTKYLNATLYGYEEKWHIGFCYPWTVGDILHIICGDYKDPTTGVTYKKWTTDVTTCEGGFPCINGACQLCKDSDADPISDNPDLKKGKNFNKQGKVTVIKEDGTIDFASDDCYSFYLREYYCDGNVYKSDTKKCEEEKVCKVDFDLGVGEYIAKCVTEVKPSCVDFDTVPGSDDEDLKKGINFGKKSKVIETKKDGSVVSHPDGCFDINTKIQEYYCNGDVYAYDTKKCEVGTICNVYFNSELKENVIGCVPEVEPTCVDLDTVPDSDDEDLKKGINFGKKSEVIATGKDGSVSTMYDGCLGPDKLKEYYCNGDVYAYDTKECEEGQVCKVYFDDKLLKEFVLECVSKCEETDKDNKPDVPGTVIDFKTDPYHDFCEGQDKDNPVTCLKFVKQYKCDPVTNEVTEAGTTECPNCCDGGVCLK